MIKVGAACKMLAPDGSLVPDANLGTTTVKKLTSLSVRDRREWLWALVHRNLLALDNQIRTVATWPAHRRMWRIGSDVLPVFTHPVSKSFYDNNRVMDEIGRRLLITGKYARKHQIRLSFHPGQFVVLGSQNPLVREQSIAELEYHAMLFARMGYKGWHPDGLSINVHVGLKDPNVKAMRELIKKASSDVQNLLTLENDEFSWCAQRVVDEFGDLVPLVLDVHHYWIHQGVRLKATQPLVSSIKETWRGVQPKLHLAMSYPELCKASADSLTLSKLLADGNTKAKLRVHADEPWHHKCIEYAGSFGFDIMWEGGNKNLGAAVIAKQLNL